MIEFNLDTMTHDEIEAYLADLKLLLEQERKIGERMAANMAEQVKACWDIFNES